MAFKVTRSVGVLVKPSESTTPTISLNLSVIDKLDCMRANLQTLHVFKHGASDTAKVIKEALSKALVPYYPLAGRLQHSPQGDLQVACTAEGVWFVEASTDCSLASLNYFDNVPMIPTHDLLPITPPGISPLILIQVTSFTCQGFTLGLIFNHSVLDGLGAAQFMNAVGEYARGFLQPTITPSWHREMIPSPARLTHTFTSPPSPKPPSIDFLYSCIDVSTEEINKAKNNYFTMTGEHCSTFDLIAAGIWRQRTRAICMNEYTEVKLAFAFNTRNFLDPPLPAGFYGNCIFLSTVVSTSGWVVKASISEVVKLIRDAKVKTPGKFKEWLESEDMDEIDDAFICPLSYTTLYLSEWGHLGFNQVDYGWGEPVHFLPVQSQYLPTGTIGLLPKPKNGVRILTWCVTKDHLPFMDQPLNLS